MTLSPDWLLLLVFFGEVSPPAAVGAEEVQQTHVNQHPNNGPAEKDLSHPDKCSRKDGPHGLQSFLQCTMATSEGGVARGGWS